MWPCSMRRSGLTLRGGCSGVGKLSLRRHLLGLLPSVAIEVGELLFVELAEHVRDDPTLDEALDPVSRWHLGRDSDPCAEAFCAHVEGRHRAAVEIDLLEDSTRLR